MSLAYGKVLKDSVIQDIARQHNATPAQVALARALQLGYSVILSSTKRENLARCTAQGGQSYFPKSQRSTLAIRAKVDRRPARHECRLTAADFVLRE